MNEVDKKYLLSYMYNTSDSFLERKYIDYFKFELDRILYMYGDHVSTGSLMKKKYGFKDFIKDLMVQYKIRTAKAIDNNANNIICSATIADRQRFENEYSCIFYNSPFANFAGYKCVNTDSFKLSKKIEDLKNKSIFKDFFSKSLHIEIEAFQEKYIKFLNENNFKACFLYTDEDFNSKFLIDSFKQTNGKSFVFVHGIPAIYSETLYTRSDYIVVWGAKMKQVFIDKGFDPTRIIVGGSARYGSMKIEKDLRNNLGNVLVVPVSSCNDVQHSWDRPLITDRSMCILYALDVKSVLLEMGVKHARLRVHPTISKEWLKSYLVDDFYTIDYESPQESLRKSTLVIGATSTMLLDALAAGVNYIVYEPVGNDGMNLLNMSLVPPFDNSKDGIFVTHTTNELKNMVREHYTIDPTSIKDYIEPLNYDMIGKIINNI